VNVLITLLLLPSAAALPQEQEPFKLSYTDLLAEYRDLTLLAETPLEGVSLIQFSSTDPSSTTDAEIADTWFSNKDRGNYLREEQFGEEQLFVMAECLQAGSIMRLWVGNPNGDILFFVDGNSQPSLRLPMTALFDGSHVSFQPPLASIQANGHSSYVPLPFDRSIKVCTTADNLYYHVGIRKYPAGTRLPSLNAKLLSDQQEELDFINSLLGAREFVSFPRRFTNYSGRYRPNLEQHININGSGAVRSVTVTMPDAHLIKDFGSVLSGLRVRVVADRSKSAQVDIPFGDFFAIGPSASPSNSWLTKVVHEEDGSIVFANFIPMPFSEAIRIEIINESRRKVLLKTRVVYEEGEARPLRLHGGWHGQKDLLMRPPLDWSVLVAEGPGRLVSTGLSIRNLSPNWWGEGDEKITIDGEATPSIWGTGADAFFGFFRGSTELFSNPFGAQTRCDGPDNYGWTVLNRNFISDAIPFQQSIVFELGLWHWDKQAVDLATWVFWYAPLDAGDQLEELPDPDYREPRLVPEAPPSSSTG